MTKISEILASGSNNNCISASRRLSAAGFDSMSPMSQELLQSLKTSSAANPEKSKILSENFVGHLVPLP
jgi:hypothetical protein